MLLLQKLQKELDALQPALLETVRESVCIPSVMGKASPEKPYGEQVNRALLHALETARKLGFSAQNLDGQVGFCEYGSGAEMVAVLGHLDVVPEGEGWHFPPFEAQLVEGKLYGRGTMDDKGPLFACLYGLKALADAKIPLKRRVRILFGTNEENGSAEMSRYTEYEELPVMAFTPDGEFPVIYAEKGMVNLRVSCSFSQGDSALRLLSAAGGIAANVVPASCWVRLAGSGTVAAAAWVQSEATRERISLEQSWEGGELLLCTRGKSAHGSVPQRGRNAVSAMLQLLCGLPLEKKLLDFLTFHVQKIDCTGTALGLDLQDETGALTMNLGMLHVEDGVAESVLNVRCPILLGNDAFLQPFFHRAAEAQMEVEVLLALNPLYYPKDHPLIRRLLQVYQMCSGENGEPLAIGGGTYAKELPNTVAFGPLFPGRLDLNHQANEYIELDELRRLTQIYAQAIYALAND